MSEIDGDSQLDVSELREMDIPSGIKFKKLGFLTYAGVMKKITFPVTFAEIAERFTFNRLLNRHDYDIDNTNLAGNRDVTESHWKKIIEGVKSTDRPYLGTLTVALDEKHCHIEDVRSVSEHVSLVVLTVYEDAPNPIIEDGQHRIMMATHLWPQVKDATEGHDAEIREFLEKTSIEMTILLEDDADVLGTIFVRMGSTKPISPNLIAVMDRSTVQNRLGLYVTRNSKLLSDRVSYLSTTASRRLAEKKGRKFEDLYPAAAVRSAAASMAGVGVRDRTPEQRENLLKSIVDAKAKGGGMTEDAAIDSIGKDIISSLDYAYRRIPGWKQLSTGTLTVAEFKRKYVHSSAAGLHVIANVIAAGRAQGLNPRAVVDGLAKLPWDRAALREARNDAGEDIEVHEFFEGTLAATSFDTKAGSWRAGTGGATRSNYEPAIDKVLRHLASEDAALKPLAERAAAVAIGLISAKPGPGRPKKIA
ncbi:DNA sulfur modification protein DndB [Kribbella kalugense]|uniref:DndB-like DNA-sulfur modification-associated protein n=1 Tax=Kribbella kalugense TaxID=2512221 RepID=A0A4V3G825_9ACTN|nr:DNA sulfur modification protein DndB [Kribbella kalugense]TDW21244.1 DndB-like DNA-sulfur modification-associated protein [Kribbella kalugense]